MNRIKGLIRGCAVLCSLFITTFSLHAQYSEGEPVRMKTSATTLEMGSGSLYDTYLSGNNYSGTSLALGREVFQLTPFGNNHVVRQQQLRLSYTSGLIPSGTASMLSAFLDYSCGWLYRFEPTSALSLYAGGAADFALGGIYNPMNSNNPATAKVSLNLDLTAMAVYNLRVGNYPVKLRYQISMPLLGVFFSPHYQQSYYEIFDLGNYEGVVHLGSLHNQTNLHNLFTADFPLWGHTFRLGYRQMLRSNRVSEIDTYITSHSLLLGYVFNKSPKCIAPQTPLFAY